MTTQEIKDDYVVDSISKLSLMSRLCEVIYVEDSIGEIDITKTTKSDVGFKSFKFKLKKLRLLIKDRRDRSNLVITDTPKCNTISRNVSIGDCVSVNINHIFISELSTLEKTERYSFKYFNQGLFKTIFNRNTESDLIKFILDMSVGCSWVIAPEFFLDIINKSNLFKQDVSDYPEIVMYNLIDSELKFYINIGYKDNLFYMGNYESVSVLIKRNVNLVENEHGRSYKNSRSMEVEYLILETGLTKSISVD